MESKARATSMDETSMNAIIAKHFPEPYYAIRAQDLVREVLESSEKRVGELPPVLFDGYAVFKALSLHAQARTSQENVADVLDAVVYLLRLPKCPTCNGQGMVSRHMPDGSHDDELCPECNRL